VPLSEREQQILEEIEKSLYQEDPRFAREVKRKAPRMAERQRVKLGALIAVGGFAALIVFFVTQVVFVGVVAFGAMVGGIVIVAGSIKASLAPRRQAGPALQERIATSMRSFEERLRDRYRKP